MKKRTIFPNAYPVPYGRLNIVKRDNSMSGKKKEDPKGGVSEKLFQLTISYFVNHPDRWILRREIQTALGIGKTQACRLFQALSSVPCLENNDDDEKPDNSPLMYRLSSDSLNRAERELYQISTLTNEDRTILTTLMDMANSTGLYGDMIEKLKEHHPMSSRMYKC